MKQFNKLSRRLTVQRNTIMTEQGKIQRDFYILISGEALVYKRNQSGERFLISEIEPNSVFGEVGFLLGEPRTADIITKSACEFIQIQFDEVFFNSMIKKEIAESLQKRFWMLHALNKSKYFRDLPDDVFDSLIFAGNTVTVPSNHIIFKEGELGAICYFIIQGSAVFLQGGKVINVLGQGDCFGEIALFYSQGVRTASAVAQRECILAMIDRDTLYRTLGNNILLGKELQLIAEARLRKDQERTS